MSLRERYARRARQAKAMEGAGRGVNWAMLLAGSLLFVLPFAMMVFMSLKTPAEIASSPAWAWPKHPTLDNYAQVLSNPNVSFQLFLKNTSLVTFLTTLGVLLSSAAVAYGFARIDFVGRDRLFMVLLSTMMLPGIVTMIPSYVLFAKIHWVNTFLPLWVPAWFGGGAFNVFLLRQFFMGIPRELDEAALLDGAGHWTIFSRVVLPLSGSALATVGVFTFMGSWRDFMGPLLYLNDPDLQTLELGLRTYQTLRNEEWHLIMAASVLVTIPLVAIFFLGQRFFTKGIAMTGLK